MTSDFDFGGKTLSVSIKSDSSCEQLLCRWFVWFGKTGNSILMYLCVFRLRVNRSSLNKNLSMLNCTYAVIKIVPNALISDST
jgi:hypothetical protein